MAEITEGGGTSRPSDTPSRTATSHSTASPTGRMRPSAGRVRRASRPLRASTVETEGSAETVMPTKDIGRPRIATQEMTERGTARCSVAKALLPPSRPLAGRVGEQSEPGWGTKLAPC